MTSLNPRISGPVHAHLTPCSGIYFNAFIHEYSSRAGKDNPFGTYKCYINRNFLSPCPFVASFKTISCLIVYIFFHVFSTYIAQGRGRQHIGDKTFDDNRKAFSLCPFVASFKMISLKSDLYKILMILYMYMALGKGIQPLGDKLLCQQKALITSTICCKFQTKISLNSDFKHIF